jgi:hypothetical protein
MYLYKLAGPPRAEWFDVLKETMACTGHSLCCCQTSTPNSTDLPL